MSLEFNQGLHDNVIVNSGNVSASLDPKQIPNDANDGLIKAAAKFAAGKELGLSEEETLSAISRQSRASARPDTSLSVETRAAQASAQLGKVPGLPKELSDAGSMENLQKRGSGQRKRFESTDTEFTDDERSTILQDMENPAFSRKNREISEEVDRRTTSNTAPSGQFVGRSVDPSDREIIADRLLAQLAAGKDPISSLRVDQKEASKMLKAIVGDLGFSPRELEVRTKQGKDARLRSKIADAIKRRNYTVPSEITDTFLGDAIYDTDRRREPSAMRQSGNVVPSLLRDEVNREELRKMRQASADLRASEAARMSNPDMEAVNYFKAMADARDALGEGTIGLDINIPSPGNYPQAVEEDFGPFGKVYVDPSSGEAITPFDYAIAGANTPDSGQMLNAPQGATEFVAHAVNEGSQFTRNQVMAGVDVGSELAGLDDAVARLGQSRSFQGLQLESDQIRTLDALDKAVGAITAMAVDRNIPMYRMDPETKKRKRVSPGEAGIAEVMTALRIDPAQQERIGIALAQSEGARRSTPYEAKPTGARGVTLEKAQGPTVGGTPGYYVSEAAPTTPDVISLDRPGRSSLLSGGKGGEGGKITEASVPIKRMPAGGKNPMRSILKKAAEKGTISPEAAAPFMAAVEGERANPTISISSAQAQNPSDISAATRVERLERTLGKGAVARGAATLRKQGNPQPRFDDVMNFLEGEYQSAGGKPMDEAELSRTIGRKEAVARRGQETEDAAMARLLSGPLKPGPDLEEPPAPSVGPSSVTEERRRRRGIPPAAITAAGGGLLAALALNSGGES